MGDSETKPDLHKVPGMLVRLPAGLREKAQAILGPKDWTMTEFVYACIVLLTKNPKAFLARLEEFRPPRKRGRPPKEESKSHTGQPQ